MMRLWKLSIIAAAIAGSQMAGAALKVDSHHRPQAESSASGADRKAGEPQKGGSKSNSAPHLPRADERSANAEKTEEKEQRQIEVHAQVQSATWAKVSAIVAALGLLVTVAGTYLLLAQITLTRKAMQDTQSALATAREANEIALQNAYAERRPWVSITSLTVVRVIINDPFLIMEMDVGLTAFGTTPVQDAKLRYRPFPASRIKALFQYLQNDDGVTSPVQWVGSIYPGETKTVRMRLMEPIKDALDAEGGHIEMAIVLRYWAAEDRQEHVVGQHWSIGSRFLEGSLEAIRRDDHAEGTGSLVATARETHRMT